MAVDLDDAVGDLLDSMNVTFTTNATCICLGHCACTVRRAAHLPPVTAAVQ